jgi:hypothetical protein
MGGGSLGHAPVDDVDVEAPLRNNPPNASQDAGSVRQDHGANELGRAAGNATGSEDDSVMPEDDATLKTKI